MSQSAKPQTIPTINIVINQTALSNSHFKESIDLALVCAAFDQTINLIFVDNGIFNLTKNQNYQELSDKNHLDILKGLEFYDVDNIYVEQESLDERKMTRNNLIDVCKTLNAAKIKKLHIQSDQVVIL